MLRTKTENIIKNFEKKCKGPLQGSQEWLDIRIPNSIRKRGRIGGSEIGSLLGVNPFKSKKELMLNKLGKKKSIVDNIMVHMGSLLEEVTVMFFEKEFNTKVYAKNISLIDPISTKDFIFSPDGIAYLPNINNKIKVDKIEDDNTICSPVLIEIKNPWSRLIVQDGKVPEQYMSQIQAGLLSIPIAHCGIFIDSKIKLCSYEQLSIVGYNNNIHKSKDVDFDEDYISSGIILIDGKLPSNFPKKYCNSINIEDKKIYDFGNCNYGITHTILKLCKSNNLTTHYLSLDEDLDLSLIEKKYIGVICFKLYDISYTTCYRNMDKINKIKEELNNYSSGVYDIDEDYVHRAKKVKKNNTTNMPSIEFDIDASSDSD